MYEGRCQFCGRDIGGGHETYCPYYTPKEDRSMKDPTAVEEAQSRCQHGPQPGEAYTHYRGGHYVIVARSVKEDTLEQLVTYRSSTYGYVWTRTLENFEEWVPEAKMRRFTRCPTGDLPKEIRS